MQSAANESGQIGYKHLQKISQKPDFRPLMRMTPGSPVQQAPQRRHSKRIPASKKYRE